jgi:hypothetical protein
MLPVGERLLAVSRGSMEVYDTCFDKLRTQQLFKDRFRSICHSLLEGVLAFASDSSATSLTLFEMPTFAMRKSFNVVDGSRIVSKQFNATGNQVLMLD